MNDDAIASYLLYRMYPHPIGLHNEVRTFSLPFHTECASYYSEEYYLDLLKKNVRNAVGDAKDVWIPLSGGLDSSSILWAVRTELPDVVVHAIHARFPDNQNDEYEYAKIVAEKFDVQLQVTILDAVFSDHANIVKAIGEPKWTLYTKYLYDQCKDYPILSGMGGDELFGGYSWKYAVAMRYNPVTVFEKATVWQVANNYGVPRKFLGDKIKYFRLDGLVPYFVDDRPFLDQFRRCDLYNKAVWDFCWTEKLMCDRFGYNIRYPFLERHMIEYGMGLPTEHLICEGLGKTIMRNAMIGKLPEEIILRGKTGFGPNVVKVWDRELLDLCTDVFVEDSLAVQLGYLNGEHIETVMMFDRISNDYAYEYVGMANALSLEYYLRGEMEDESVRGSSA